jgi:hypothetical protein
MDHVGGIAPETFAGTLVSATSSCVAIGTLSEMDGPTTIVLTDESAPDASSKLLVFDDSIVIPGRILSVVTTLNDVVLSLPIHEEAVRVRIWVNDAKEPDRIVVAARKP